MFDILELPNYSILTLFSLLCFASKLDITSIRFMSAIIGAVAYIIVYQLAHN